MGYNDEGAGRCILDLETAPIEDAGEYVEPVDAPSNYKDAAKIEAYIKAAQAEKLDKAALDPDLCRIVAVGIMNDQRGPQEASQVLCACSPKEEESLLATVWWAIGERQIIGFNILQFDALVLLRRSLYLNIQAPRLQVEKFKHPRIVDLMLDLSFNGMLKYHSLDFYCKRFGLDVPEDEIDGSQIPALVAAGRWDDVANHCRACVSKTALLAERLGQFKRVQEPVL